MATANLALNQYLVSGQSLTQAIRGIPSLDSEAINTVIDAVFKKNKPEDMVEMMKAFKENGVLQDIPQEQRQEIFDKLTGNEAIIEKKHLQVHKTEEITTGMLWWKKKEEVERWADVHDKSELTEDDITREIYRKLEDGETYRKDEIRKTYDELGMDNLSADKISMIAEFIELCPGVSHNLSKEALGYVNQMIYDIRQEQSDKAILGKVVEKSTEMAKEGSPTLEHRGQIAAEQEEQRVLSQAEIDKIRDAELEKKNVSTEPAPTATTESTKSGYEPRYGTAAPTIGSVYDRIEKEGFLRVMEGTGRNISDYNFTPSPETAQAHGQTPPTTIQYTNQSFVNDTGVMTEKPTPTVPSPTPPTMGFSPPPPPPTRTPQQPQPAPGGGGSGPHSTKIDPLQAAYDNAYQTALTGGYDKTDAGFLADRAKFDHFIQGEVAQLMSQGYGKDDATHLARKNKFAEYAKDDIAKLMEQGYNKDDAEYMASQARFPSVEKKNQAEQGTTNFRQKLHESNQTEKSEQDQIKQEMNDMWSAHEAEKNNNPARLPSRPGYRPGQVNTPTPKPVQLDAEARLERDLAGTYSYNSGYTAPQLPKQHDFAAVTKQVSEMNTDVQARLAAVNAKMDALKSPEQRFNESINRMNAETAKAGEAVTKANEALGKFNEIFSGKNDFSGELTEQEINDALRKASTGHEKNI